MKKRGTYYHVSYKYLGKRPTLTPRTPMSRAASEPDTPRICVAPTVWGCVLGIMGIDAGFPIPSFHVYEVDAETVPAKGVYDARSTGERWIMQPVTLKHICKVRGPIVDPRVNSWVRHQPYIRRRVADMVHSAFLWAVGK